MLVSRQVSCGLPQLFVVRRMFFWALVLMVPFLLFGVTDMAQNVMEGSMAVHFSPSVNAARFSHAMNYFNLCFLGIFASAICFVLWNKACAVLGTARCTVGIYFLPAITVLFAAICLGERMTLASGMGTVLIILGVFLSGKTGEKSS